MNAKARAELRADLIAFACYLDDADLEDDALVVALTAFLIRQAALYGCLPLTIRRHYAAEIDRLGVDQYFHGFRPELN